MTAPTRQSEKAYYDVTKSFKAVEWEYAGGFIKFFKQVFI